MADFTVIVPFWNAHRALDRLLGSLPDGVPVLVVDDHSDRAPTVDRRGVDVVRPPEKGFFSGAVNYGASLVDGDFLVVNQDVWFDDDGWLELLSQPEGPRQATVGDGVHGHPAWREGYVQGTFMWINREAWDDVGPLDGERYPLWGSTCEWQLRACRKGWTARPLRGVPGLKHQVRRPGQVGHAIGEAVRRWPERRREFLRTPPMVSVVMPCHNYGRYLDDALNCLLGGSTSLGDHPGQDFMPFEVVIVDDASTDGSQDAIREATDHWKGVRSVLLRENLGTAGAMNAGVARSFGQYVHILSVDDMREPWALRRLVGALEENPRSVVYFGEVQLFSAGERRRVLPLQDYDFEKMLHKNPMGAGVMYPRKAWDDVGGYPPRMRYGREDWAFNIALGLKGWCGLKLNGRTGNLYRREGQNRSVRTQGKEWMGRFRAQLMSLYPQAYEGEWPIMCCGDRRSRSASNPSRKRGKAAMKLPGQDGFQLLEYVGKNKGSSTWYGPMTGTTYRAGANPLDRFLHVDKRDVAGMLAMKKGKTPVFSVVVTPEPEPDLKVDAAEAERVNPGTIDPEVATPRATIKAADLAGILGVHLFKVKGTGKDGLITIRDVRAAARGD